MSLLLTAGHADAMHYPVHRVWEEAEIVVQRENAAQASRGLLLQLAVSSAMSGSKSARQAFKKMIEDLTDGEG